MKRNAILIGMMLLTGCSHMNNTEAGALGGGIIGAGLGTVVGGITGRPGLGAAIGGASGALVGGAVGSAEDRRERKEAQAVASWQARNQMTMQDVVQMTHQHIGDDVIIQQIDTTYTNFDLRAEDVTFLKQQGVSDRVVMTMQRRRTLPPSTYRARPAGGVVVYDPYPPPPPISVGVGFGYHSGPRRCW